MHERKCCCRARELTTDCVCRLLIMGRACGSIYFIFMSQMVHVVLFMNKLAVQNTSVSKAVCGMQRDSKTELSLETLTTFFRSYSQNVFSFYHWPWCCIPCWNELLYIFFIFLYIILGLGHYSSFHAQAVVRRNTPFKKKKKKILFTVREVESRLACKRPALFCLSDRLAC